MFKVFILFSGLLILLSSCGSFSSVKTAKPDPGIGIGLEMYSYGVLGQRIQSTNEISPLFLDISVWGRFLPFKEFWELGGRVSIWGTSIDSKFVFWNTNEFALAADVEAGMPYMYSFRTMDLTASLLFTYQPVQPFSVTLIPKYRWAMLSLPMVGGSVVFSFFNTETFSLLFDVSYIRFLPNSYSEESDDILSQMMNDVYNSFDAFSATIGFQFNLPN